MLQRTASRPDREREADALAGLLGGRGSGAAFDELLETRNRVESILQVVVGDDGVLVQDFSGRIAYANEPAATILDARSAAELLRTSPRELSDRLSFEDEDSGERRHELPGMAILGGAPASERTSRVRSDSGMERWVIVRTLPMHDGDGNLAASVTILRDITEQRRDAAFREKVLAIVSHDLRTPLTAIAVTAGLIRRRSKETAPWVATAAQRIQDAAERGARMVRDLLDLTQARTGRGIPIELGRLTVAELIGSIVDEVSAAQSDRVIRVRCQQAGEANWDADRIRQVLTNLLGNALTHSPGDSEVTVTARGGPDTVVIAVNNQGAPIPPEKMRSLFEPFVQGERKANAQRSIGLGLYIVKEIVAAHGGSIEVASTETDGTTFTLELPR